MDDTSAIVKAGNFANNPAQHEMNSAAAKNFTGLLLIAAIGAGSAGVIWLRQSTPLFESTAAVRVVRDETDLEQLPADAPAGLDNAVFLQNEAELVRSDPVLYKVIKRLKLNQDWGNPAYDGQRIKTSETSAMLKGWVQVFPEPGTALLRIQATSDTGIKATQLADALAAAYCEYRQERRQRLAQETIDALASAYQENEAKVRRASELVAQTHAALDPALREQNPPPAPAGENDAALRTLRTRYTRATMTQLTVSNQLARSTNLPAEDLQKLTAQVDQAHMELTHAEAALQLELKKQAALRTYWEARQELEKANLVFAPIQATVAEKQHFAQSVESPPALIAEAASPARALPTSTVAAQLCLVGAGILLVVAGKRFFQPRRPPAKS